jgi:hypothetical protein
MNERISYSLLILVGKKRHANLLTLSTGKILSFPLAFEIGNAPRPKIINEKLWLKKKNKSRKKIKKRKDKRKKNKKT